MKKREEATVVMLSSNDEKAREGNIILSTRDDRLSMLSRETHGKGIFDVGIRNSVFHADNLQHLYVTINDLPKKGEWFYDRDNVRVAQWTMSYSMPQEYSRACSKIIATTDQKLYKLHDNGVLGQGITRMADIPDSFIREYIERYNEGDGITSVLIECENNYNLHYHTPPGGVECCEKTDNWRPKVNPKGNTILIQTLERKR